MEPVKFSANFWENMTTQPLKPCPFCGKLDDVRLIFPQVEGAQLSSDEEPKITCIKCIAKDCGILTIQNWNTRAGEEVKE